MKGNPFVRYTAALVGGILAYVCFPDWTAVPLGALLIGAGLLVLGMLQTAGQPVKPIQLGSGLGGLLLLQVFGWGIACQRTPANQSDHLIHRRDTLRAYEGVVASQPEERARSFRVELAVRRGKVGQAGHEAWQPLQGRVIVYLDKAGQPMPRYGEVWLVSGSPRPIDPPLNPGEFNYRRYLAFRGIYHQQYVRVYERKVLAVEPPSRVVDWATQVNRWAVGVFSRQLANRAEYGIVNAMILGVRDDLDSELYKAYASAGAIHILSVSGLHVGILFTFLTYLLGFLIKRPRGKLLMAVLQLGILWFYALVTGFSPPVLRSAAMFSLLIVANAAGRQQQLINSLAASAFFILCFDPYALFSAGFQLSYLAVGGIGAWQSPLYQSVTFRTNWMNKLWKLTAVALVAQLITFPLGAYYFHQFPTYFLLANPIVIVMSQLLLPLAMATLALGWIPCLGEALGWLLEHSAWLLNKAVSLTGLLPGATWDGLWISPLQLVLIYLVIFCAVALLNTRQRSYLWATSAASLLLAIISVQTTDEQARQQRLTVHFLPHRTAVSLTQGRESLLFTDLDTTDVRSYDFYLKNTFGQWGVSTVKTIWANSAPEKSSVGQNSPALYQTRDLALWVHNGKTVLLVNRLNGRERWRLPALIDYLIIRRNALQGWEQLNGRVVARHIIFDDSNKTPLTDRLLAQAAERGIRCYSVRQMGAFVAEL